MKLLSLIPTGHKYFIHDIKYDYYGRRIATCSSDQEIKIWDLVGNEQRYECTQSWKAHNASIWKVEWSHPRFGQLLASCSQDKTVLIFEESKEKEFKSKPISYFFKLIKNCRCNQISC